MKTFQVANIKDMMAHLLLGETFDEWLLAEAQVTTFCTFNISGFFQKAYDAADAAEPANTEAAVLVPWKRVREFCFSLMRGERTPIAFRLSFVLPPEKAHEFLTSNGAQPCPDDLSGLYMNIAFRNRRLMITVLTSRQRFCMDKQLDAAWTEYVEAQLKNLGVTVKALR